MNAEALLAHHLSEDKLVDHLLHFSIDELADLVKEAAAGPISSAPKRFPVPPRPIKKTVALNNMRFAVKRMTDTAQRLGMMGKGKVSSAQDIVTVSGWARELARTDLKKSAGVLDTAGREATKAVDWLRKAGPGGRAAVGAAAGAALGGSKTVDQEGRVRRSSRIPGALVGAGAGALSHPAGRAWAGKKIVGLVKSSSIEKEALSPLFTQAINRVGPLAGRALQWAKNTARIGAGSRMAVGAGIGAGAGALRQAMRSPQERQQHSLLGSMAGGAALGAGAGLAAPAAASRAMQIPGVQSAMYGQYGAQRLPQRPLLGA